jgi:CHAT domain-containing protein
LWTSEQPQKAAAAAQRAIDTAEARGDRARLPQFQLRLAKANIVWGRLDEAERALAAGIQAFDEQHATLIDDRALSAHDESWQLFETALRLAIRRGDLERAFAMAERARSRTIAEGRAILRVPTLAETRAALKPGEVVLALNQFQDELVVWAITHDTVRLSTRPLTQPQTAQLVARQQMEISRGSAAPGAGAILFDEIVRPLSAEFRDATRLTVIPDMAFQDVSFGAFWNRAERRFLIQALDVMGAPSFTAFAAATKNSADRRSDDVLVLSANAQADVAARAIADIYPQPTVLQGTDATRSRFLGAVQQHGLVHLAAPSRTNAAFPFLAGVSLADDSGQRHSGLVFGRDIAARSLLQTKLVVLDEIEAGRDNRGGGTLSIARAFMAAGVPAVLGTLPGANEGATRDLMIGFHREIAKGVSAEQALSTVQRNALQQNGGRLGAWTALVLYGSDR